jgi:DNA repair protein RecO (recombination protein O)
MPEWTAPAIVLSARAHGETGGIVSVLTEEHGRVAAYVYGISSARTRAALEPGSGVAARWQAKADGQLGHFTFELESSPAVRVMDEPLKLLALQSACAVADAALPEREPHPGVYAGLGAFLTSLESDIWPAVYVAWEMGLLAELGLGLDLSTCAATGETEDLIYVSPRSGRAVSRAAGALYKEKMLALPAFLRGGVLDDAGAAEGLRLSGHFLLHRVFGEAGKNLPPPRLRLEEELSALNNGNDPA